MQPLSGTERDDAVFVVRKFLRSGITGCEFAQAHADKQESRISWSVFAGQTLTPESCKFLSWHFDGAGQLKRPAFVVFPELRTAAEIVALLAVLAGDPRWSLRHVAWTKHPRDGVLVGLWWRTSDGFRSSVMGLAPLGSMPVVRRAPFVALALWPGGKLNEEGKARMMKRLPPTDEVGFIDMPPLVPDAHDEWWQKTRDQVKLRNKLPAEGAAQPMVSFCLPAECSAELRKLPGLNANEG